MTMDYFYFVFWMIDFSWEVIQIHCPHAQLLQHIAKYVYSRVALFFVHRRLPLSLHRTLTNQLDDEIREEKTCFFKCFRAQGHPRQPRKAQQGSQDAPEELQNLEKKDQKWTSFLQFV